MELKDYGRTKSGKEEESPRMEPGSSSGPPSSAAPRKDGDGAPKTPCIWKQVSPTCSMLTKANVGPAWKVKLCELCGRKNPDLKKGMRIWWRDTDRPYHIDEDCPRNKSALKMRGCAVCTGG